MLKRVRAPATGAIQLLTHAALCQPVIPALVPQWYAQHCAKLRRPISPAPSASAHCSAAPAFDASLDPARELQHTIADPVCGGNRDQNQAQGEAGSQHEGT